MGEPPIRRHLKLEVAMLLQQAARGARERLQRRLAVLGGRRAADDALNAVGPAPAVGEAAVAVHPPLSDSLPAVNRPESQKAPAARPGARAELPATVSRYDHAALETETRAVAQADLKAKPEPASQPDQLPAGRPAQPRLREVSVPPLVRLMRAAAVQAEKAEALEREALAAWRVPEVTPAERLVLTGRLPRMVAAASRADGRVAGGTAPTAEAAVAYSHGAGIGTEASAPVHGTPAPLATMAPNTQRLALEEGTRPWQSAPFGPHPTAPGPVPAAAANPGGPSRTTPPAPSYPESELLAEAQLRERLASILRADGLRHGLDLKER